MVSGRPTAGELAGTRRIYLDDRTLSLGELGAESAFSELVRTTSGLVRTHPLVIMEGGSISLCRLVAERAEQLGWQMSVEVKLAQPNSPAYLARVRRRVVAMLAARPSLLDELVKAWQHVDRREFIASICGFDAVLDWCAENDRQPSEFDLSPSETAVLVDRIVASHSRYAQLQMKALHELGLH